MSTIPDKTVDMVLCDLPYGVTAQNKWDIVIPFHDLWAAYKRVCKPNAAIVLTATDPFASQLIVSNLSWYRYDWSWVKNKSTGFLNAKKMPLRRHERVLVFYQNLPTYNPQKTLNCSPVHAYSKKNTNQSIDGPNYGQTKPVSGGGSTERYPTSVLYFPVVNNDSPDRIHPTQKPVPLFEYLIKTYTNENDLVLDNCIGSGTTAIACINSNRRYLGIESNPVYHEKCVNRIGEHTNEEKSNRTNSCKTHDQSIEC
jgi:site-specific DNA-methyltransferase (adenine-specific)